jgi:hypothetical protein
VARRRTIEVFTLSFLDCICCGFGAVILFYTIVSAQSGVVRLKETDRLSSEVSRLKEQVLTGERNLVVLHDTLQKTRNETASATRETNRIVTDLESRREQLSSYDASTSRSSRPTFVRSRKAPSGSKPAAWSARRSARR